MQIADLVERKFEMDSNTSSGIRIEKLDETNFYSWKQKIELVLGYKEVDEMIDPHLCPTRPEEQNEHKKWLRKDKLARLYIGLSVSGEMLKNLQHTTTALEMWNEICNLYQRHTLPNTLTARREFCTVTVKEDEKMLVYVNRVRQLASILESMDVCIDDKELPMAVLNGLPGKYNALITALDTIGDDNNAFTFDKVRSR